MSVKNLTFMAFAKGEISSEGANFKRYIGVGSVQLLGISPTKAQLEGILNTTLDNEPSYVSEIDRDGKKIPSARVELIFKTVPENNDGIEDIIRVSLFVNKEYRFNRDNTKVQVMDIYGRTAWVTQEQLKNHEIPMYSNGPANLDKDYRPVFRGEEALTQFFIAFLNIPSPQVYKDKKWVDAPDKSKSLARFDHIENLFNGDFKELQEAWQFQKDNKVKVLFGVRTNSEGHQYQDFYNRMFLKNGATSYDRLEKDVEQAKEAGAYPNTEFRIEPLQEYTVKATNLDAQQPDPANNPFGNPDDNPFFQK